MGYPHLYPRQSLREVKAHDANTRDHPFVCYIVNSQNGKSNIHSTGLKPLSPRLALSIFNTNLLISAEC